MTCKANYKLCRVCGSPHGKSLCPVAGLNSQQELTAGIVPESESSKQFQIRALRRLWLMSAHKDDHSVPVIAVNPAIDVMTAAERLRQAWGVRA